MLNLKKKKTKIEYGYEIFSDFKVSLIHGTNLKTFVLTDGYLGFQHSGLQLTMPCTTQLPFD